jgi:16S rRNA (cytosine1402-N4)-methyltransferase
MPKKNPEHFFTLLTKKPVDPQADEVQRNPRSRSARLRVAERISDANGKESA